MFRRRKRVIVHEFQTFFYDVNGISDLFDIALFVIYKIAVFINRVYFIVYSRGGNVVPVRFVIDLCFSPGRKQRSQPGKKEQGSNHNQSYDGQFGAEETL